MRGKPAFDIGPRRLPAFSGEKFEATNIIGRVLEPQKLKDVSEGETIYIKEVR